jgi:hypothetical protein
MSLKGVIEYVNQDDNKEQNAIEAFQKLEPFDQIKLMLWLAKRDPTICDTQIYHQWAIAIGKLMEL